MMHDYFTALYHLLPVYLPIAAVFVTACVVGRMGVRG